MSLTSHVMFLGIHGILDTGGKILETGGIFGELKKNCNLKKKEIIFRDWREHLDITNQFELNETVAHLFVC